ncbi:MAG: 2-phosphosulfolactate phosphatase [Gemmatimonadaceae bacterium]
MKVDVTFCAGSYTPAESHGRVVVVMDVLRASTSIAVALHNGARNVVPFESADEAVARAKSFDRSDFVLAGERRMQPIAGFDLGNSPQSFSAQAVEGRTVLFTTSNGTAALVSAQGAHEVFVGSFVNLTAVLDVLRAPSRASAHLLLLCAGSDRRFSLEDAGFCAGRFIRGLAERDDRELELNDAARAARVLDKRYGDNIARLFKDAEHARALVSAGYADDLAVCAALDTYPVVPVYADRLITRMGSDREK